MAKAQEPQKVKTYPEKVVKAATNFFRHNLFTMVLMI